MPDVFSKLPPTAFRWIWGIALILFAGLWGAQLYYGRHLTNSEAPQGIVSLELAGMQAKTQAILDSWGPAARADAERGLWWDLAFLVSYALVLSHACGWAGRTMAAVFNWQSGTTAGLLFGWMAWAAAACDAGEDAGLLVQLASGSSGTWSAVARGFAIAKFAMLILCTIFVAFGVVAAVKPLRAHVRFAATHFGYVLVLGLIFGFVYGLIGTGNGIPSLFWHDHFWARLGSSFGVTLLLLEIGVIVYYEQRDDAAGLVSALAGPPGFPAGGATARTNIAYLSRFLLRGGLPLLFIVAAPAIWALIFIAAPGIAPSIFAEVTRTPLHQAGIALHLGPMSGGPVTWLLGIALGVAVAAILLFISRLLYRNPDAVLGNPIRSVMTFYVIFIAIYIIMANWPAYEYVSPAIAICAAIGILAMFYALIAYFDGLFFPALCGWWIPPKAVFLAALLALFGWANNDPYKLKFPNMEQYYGAPEPLRADVAGQYFPMGGRPALPAGGATLITDETAFAGWLKVVATGDGKKPKLAVVVVSGGATRSAYWTATVLQRLEDEIDGFSKHVRIVAGASGGMLGGACYVQELRERAGGSPPKKFPDRVPVDSITPVARNIALQEIWRSLLPVRWPLDRGIVLERDWGLIGYPIQALVPLEEQGKVPSIIFSPMMAEDGRRLLISNLDLWVLSGAEGGMITENDAGTQPHDYSLSAIEFFRIFPFATKFELATAVRMNASFPFVSPAVNLPTDPPRRVVNAGYYDNYGVQVGAAWIQKNLRWLLDKTSGVVLIQVRDAVSQKDRLEVSDAPEGLLPTIARGFQFFTSPLDAAKEARYTVSAFTNDQEVQNLSDLLTDRYLRDRLKLDPTKATPAQLAEARAFFTTAVFENSAVVYFGPRPAGSWPGDEASGSIPSNEVALDWYLSDAERAGLDTAIPAMPKPGNRWSDPKQRLARIAELIDKVAVTHGTDRDKWFKELEQARNFERLIQLKKWWAGR